MKKKVILYIAISMDGFIARENKSVDWLDSFSNTGEDYGYTSFYASVNNVILGNTTYAQFPEPYAGKQCFIFSRKEKGVYGNKTYMQGNVHEWFNATHLEGTSWLVGGADIIHQFLKYQLIDEFIISIMPVLLGSGIPLFTSGNPESPLQLLHSQSYANGVVQLHFEKK